MKKPELLSPAGTYRNMHYAFAYGADAVYAGQPKYSLRVRENDFNKLDNLANGIAFAHQQGKKFYVASNIAAHNNKVRSYLKDMKPIIEMNPDALIMSDPGLIMMIRENWPDMPVHLSVQSNAVNYATVKFWQSMGLERIILSRELSLKEIAEIRAECPDIELEVFVHGALCIAYSGRCLLSGYMTHRDSNQGACTNSCRWKYQVHPAIETPGGDVIASDDGKVALLQEKGRAGELMPVFEDEFGTYIMNSRDLRAVQHVRQLMEMGIESIKIEGRTKSYYYVARTAQVYRRAIEDSLGDAEFDMGLMDELEKLSSRGYTEGFYRRHPPGEYQNYEQNRSMSEKQQFVGDVISINDDQLTVEVKNRFQTGDSLELMTPGGNTNFVLGDMKNLKGQKMKTAPGSGHTVTFPSPVPHLHADLAAYGLILRNLPEHNGLRDNSNTSE
jgi:putative protease